MTTKNKKLTHALEPQDPAAASEKTHPVEDGQPLDDGLLMDANVGIDGGCVQPGGAEDDRPNTGASCRSSMDGG